MPFPRARVIGGGLAGVEAAHVLAKVASSGTVSSSSMPGVLYFRTSANGSVSPSDRLVIDSTGLSTFSGNICPGADNTYNFGSASLRWGTLYAATGTINTSGAESKIGTRVLTDAEIAAAGTLASSVRIFQFADAVARKGAEARLHAGMIYEDVVAAFAAQGLDPEKYGILCRDPAMKRVAVPEVCEPSYEPELDETGAPKWVLGLRYGELAQFVLAGLAARLAALEAR